MFSLFGGKPQLGRFTQKLRGKWRPRRNHVCQVSDWNLHGLWFYRGSNFRFSYWFLRELYNSAALMRCLWWYSVVNPIAFTDVLYRLLLAKKRLTKRQINFKCLQSTFLQLHFLKFLFKLVNFYRATRMHSTDYAVARCLSVRPSVCPSHAGILSKWLYMSSKFFHHRVPNMVVFSYQTG